MKSSEITILLMLLALLGGLVSLINPRLLGMKTRGAGCGLFLLVSIALFLLTGFFASAEDARESASGADSTAVATSDSAADPQGVADANPQPAADTATPAGPVATLRADTGRILVSTRRDNFDRPHLVAELPNGTEVEVLGRETTPGGERCRVRTTFAPIVTGWVRCEQVVE